MSKLNWWKTGCAMSLLCAATAVVAPAQTFTTLFSFDYTDGSSPYAGLVQAADGDLYGTTVGGGAYFYGTVLKITLSGSLTTIHTFDGTDGAAPEAQLIQAADANFYGTTSGGGANGFGGTVFRMSPNGTLTTLYSFCSQIGCVDGRQPTAALVQACDGSFYGTTLYGGANDSCVGGAGCGTVFKITPSGTLTTLYNFCPHSGCSDGSQPLGGLIQAADGNFYGTTAAGGQNGNYGTVFRITATGTLTTLYSFCSQIGCSDGAGPDGTLVLSGDENLYGTTSIGGNDNCTDGCGTIFRVTTAGTLTTLHRFDGSVGDLPYGALVHATDGNFYGTTAHGGANHACPSNGCGTLFRIAPNGAFKSLYNFCSQSGCTDGSEPWAPLVQDTNGNFYGTTFYGGTSRACAGGCGTVFSLSMGLGPFVETEPSAGKVGKAIMILGTNLTGATSVTFNGTPATFTVEASSVIKATVPAGATTGAVQVVTPSGTLSSHVPFRVAQ